MEIISISRRTDIPAFYGEWFINRIRNGEAKYLHPFTRKYLSISLKPKDIAAIVFWTKNAKPFVKYLDELDKNYKFYFNYTITGLPNIFEGNLMKTDIAEIISNFQYLANRYSPEHIVWRYDPIILSNITTKEYHLRKFEILAKELKGYTKYCIISYVDLYARVKKYFTKLEEKNIIFYRPSLKERKELAEQLFDIANAYNISLLSCCESDLLSEKIKAASCIDGELLYKLFPEKMRENKLFKKGATRKGCNCTLSKDIGKYDTCPNGCMYCYANSNKEKALAYYKQHNVNSESM